MPAAAAATPPVFISTPYCPARTLNEPSKGPLLLIGRTPDILKQGSSRFHWEPGVRRTGGERGIPGEGTEWSRVFFEKDH
jgi:hypothetical protein